MLSAEFADIKQLVKPGSRKRLQALAKLRSIAILERSLAGERVQPSETELRAQIRQIAEGRPWTRIFPGVASLRLETSGTGFDVSLRITKSEGEPIRLVSEGAPDATIVGIKRVNELDYYSLGLTQLADRLDITTARTTCCDPRIGDSGQLGLLQGNQDWQAGLQAVQPESSRPPQTRAAHSRSRSYLG